ncbi:MAG: hypothetical protein ACREWG_07255 [Gammaproteobacteria bacterium]
MNDLAARLACVLELVDREALHLAEVTQRFFGGTEAIDREWLAKQLATPEGIDRLESFGAKFSRQQDTLSDKLLPLFLRAAGELPGTAVENLTRGERLGIIPDAQEWLGARGLRNRLVHEYIDDLGELGASLDAARRFARILIEAAHAFRRYAEQRLGMLDLQSPKT